jgi:y4mF family transcriptional regulator
MSDISSFIKYQRKRLKLTQAELAAKAGVGIRFIRELEQGKESLQLNKVDQVLELFGFRLTPARQHVSVYDILLNYFNRGVKIMLTNKMVKYGIIIQKVTDAEHKIVAWKFVPNNNAIQYQRKPDDVLTENILHKDIQHIELQNEKRKGL